MPIKCKEGFIKMFISAKFYVVLMDLLESYLSKCIILLSKILLYFCEIFGRLKCGIKLNSMYFLSLKDWIHLSSKRLNPFEFSRNLMIFNEGKEPKAIVFAHSLGSIILLDLTTRMEQPLIFRIDHLIMVVSPTGLFLAIRSSFV